MDDDPVTVEVSSTSSTWKGTDITDAAEGLKPGYVTRDWSSPSVLYDLELMLLALERSDLELAREDSLDFFSLAGFKADFFVMIEGISGIDSMAGTGSGGDRVRDFVEGVREAEGVTEGAGSWYDSR